MLIGALCYYYYGVRSERKNKKRIISSYACSFLGVFYVCG
jgi:hypothetical protein